MFDSDQIGKIIPQDSWLNHRFLGCFAYDPFPVKEDEKGRLAIVNTSLHYYISGHWLLVAGKKNVLIAQDSCFRLEEILS